MWATGGADIGFYVGDPGQLGLNGERCPDSRIVSASIICTASPPPSMTVGACEVCHWGADTKGNVRATREVLRSGFPLSRE